MCFPVYPLVDNDTYDYSLLLDDGDDEDVHRLQPIQIPIATRVVGEEGGATIMELDELDEDDNEDGMPALVAPRNVPVHRETMEQWVQRMRMVMERFISPQGNTQRHMYPNSPTFSLNHRHY